MSQHHRILLLNGPNLNLLGKREPGIYGSKTLDEIVADLTRSASELGVTLEHLQSNAEHELIGRIHQAMGQVDFIIINPAAFTIPALPCAMPCWVWPSPLSRFTCQTFMPGSPSVITPICLMSPRG
jgi:hypothetical protein